MLFILLCIAAYYLIKYRDNWLPVTIEFVSDLFKPSLPEELPYEPSKPKISEIDIGYRPSLNVIVPKPVISQSPKMPIIKKPAVEEMKSIQPRIFYDRKSIEKIQIHNMSVDAFLLVHRKFGKIDEIEIYDTDIKWIMRIFEKNIEGFSKRFGNTSDPGEVIENIWISAYPESFVLAVEYFDGTENCLFIEETEFFKIVATFASRFDSK